jgi:DUF1680 family protein
MRGPLVYALEEEDNGKLLQQLFLEEKPEFTARYEPDLLGGVVTLSAPGTRVVNAGFCESQLYGEYTCQKRTPQPLRFIPYYAWANRHPGEMMVWVRI